LSGDRVETLYWPHVDNPAGTDPVAYALVDGIAGFRMLALTPDDRWSERWPIAGGAEIPRALRVELTLADGSTIERWLALQ
jgi:type II secretion system protein J